MIVECCADRLMPKTNEFKGLPVATPTACALGPRTQVFGGVGRRPPRAHVLFQSVQTACVEELDPEPNSRTAQPHPGGNLWRAQLRFDGVQHDLRPPHQARAALLRARQFHQLTGLFNALG